MRISDWSSDVCSSDLGKREAILEIWDRQAADNRINVRMNAEVKSIAGARGDFTVTLGDGSVMKAEKDRKSVVEGKSVSVRVDLGGRRIIKKKNKQLSQMRE